MIIVIIVLLRGKVLGLFIRQTQSGVKLLLKFPEILIKMQMFTLGGTLGKLQCVEEAGLPSSTVA